MLLLCLLRRQIWINLSRYTKYPLIYNGKHSFHGFFLEDSFEYSFSCIVFYALNSSMHVWHFSFFKNYYSLYYFLVIFKILSSFSHKYIHTLPKTHLLYFIWSTPSLVLTADYFVFSLNTLCPVYSCLRFKKTKTKKKPYFFLTTLHRNSAPSPSVGPPCLIPTFIPAIPTYRNSHQIPLSLIQILNLKIWTWTQIPLEKRELMSPYFPQSQWNEN